MCIPRRQDGFTLMELMVTLVIISLLATIAIPFYLSQMREGRRAEAKTELMRLAQEQEKWRTTHTTYGTSGDIPPATLSYYSVAISNNGASTYTLTATPTGDQANDSCGALSITQTGNLTAASCSDP
jgi:type IV pilus assembly protein PilE